MGRSPKKKGNLPSGNFRVQVYDYTDENGKRHYKSFTAPTQKEAKALAEKWKVLKNNEPHYEYGDITIKEAVSKYIDIKKGVLSPSTIRVYDGMKNLYFGGEFGGKKLSEVKNNVAQLWVSDLVARKLNPKTVRNAYGLLSAALDMFSPDTVLKVTLPSRKKPDLYCPSDSDVKSLLKSIEGTDLEIAVLLAAFGPMRRGEICALERSDITGNTIRVSKSMVKGPDGDWIIKQPKTYGSYRDIEFPEFVINRIPNTDGRIFSVTPDRITIWFTRALEKTGLPHFRFHDLRHYAASIMHAIGIPDQYIMQRGGWASDSVMKAIYRNAISDEAKKQNEKINKHFEALKGV